MNEFTRNRIIKLLTEPKAEFEELTLEETDKLRKTIVHTYAHSESDERSFWFGGFGAEHLYGRYAWGWLEDDFRNREVILLYRKSECQTAFRFKDGAKLIQILKRNQYGNEFFLTDTEGHFLIFNYHEGNTYGAGLAEAWVNSLRNQVFTLLNVQPDDVEITAINVLRWGHQLVFDAIYNPQGLNRKFVLTFEGCRIRDWTSSGEVEAGHTYQIILGQENYKQPANIFTRAFNCNFDYKHCTVEWEVAL